MTNQELVTYLLCIWYGQNKSPKEIAQLLNQRGLLTPDLPEPSSVTDEDGKKRICWNTPNCNVELEPGEMITTYETQAGHSIDDAHLMGLALLAASTFNTST